MDVWHSLQQERIELPSLYFSHEQHERAWRPRGRPGLSIRYGRSQERRVLLIRTTHQAVLLGRARIPQSDSHPTYAIPPQNEKRMANCSCRAKFACDVIFPKLPLPNDVLGP